MKAKPNSTKKNISKKKKDEQRTSQNSHHPHTTNTKGTNGLGSSLFRGQKIIDLQEPYNETIKPIRMGVSTRNMQNEEYNTEKYKPEQIEIKDEYDGIVGINQDEQTSNKKNGRNVISPVCDCLYSKSKYFNNLNIYSVLNSKSTPDVLTTRTNSNQDQIHNLDNMMTDDTGNNDQYSNSNICNYPQSNNQTNKNLQFLNTLMRLKAGLKSANSHAIPCQGNSLTDDESKSNTKGNGNDKCKITEVIKQTGINENSNITLNLSKFRGDKTGLKTQDLVEISNRRKKLVDNLTSVDAYLRRRHLETVSKVEKLRKKNECKECNFTPLINRRSRQICEQLTSGRLTQSPIIHERKMSTCEMNDGSDLNAGMICKDNPDKKQKSDALHGNNSRHFKTRSEIVLNLSNQDHSSCNANQIEHFVKPSNIKAYEEMIFSTKLSELSSFRLVNPKRKNASAGSIRYETSENDLEIAPVVDGNNNPTTNTNIYTEMKTTNNCSLNKGLKPVKSEQVQITPIDCKKFETSNQLVLPARKFPKLIIESPNYVNYIITSSEIVNYGTKSHNAITNPTNGQQCYDSNQIFKFSYDTKENINQSKQLSCQRSSINEGTSQLKESTIMNSQSIVQVFPVMDKIEFKMENNNQIDNIDEMSCHDHIDSEYYNNYKPHQNSEIVSIDASEVLEYNSEKTKFQNESRNLNEVEIIQKQNENNPDNVSSVLNLSKFTNFVGLTQIHSKKNLAVKQITTEAASQSNMIMTKTNSVGTIETNQLLRFDSNGNMLNSGILSDNRNILTPSNAQFKEDTKLQISPDDEQKEIIIAEINLFDDEDSKDDKEKENEEKKLMEINFFEDDSRVRVCEDDKIILFEDQDKKKKKKFSIDTIQEDNREFDIEDMIYSNNVHNHLIEIKKIQSDSLKRKLSKSFSKKLLDGNKNTKKVNRRAASFIQKTIQNEEKFVINNIAEVSLKENINVNQREKEKSDTEKKKSVVKKEKVKEKFGRKNQLVKRTKTEKQNNYHKYKLTSKAPSQIKVCESKLDKFLNSSENMLMKILSHNKEQLLNKIQKPQDFKEDDLFHEIKDLNINESSILKIDDSNTIKFEYDREIEKVRNMII